MLVLLAASCFAAVGSLLRLSANRASSKSKTARLSLAPRHLGRGQQQFPDVACSGLSFGDRRQGNQTACPRAFDHTRRVDNECFKDFLPSAMPLAWRFSASHERCKQGKHKSRAYFTSAPLPPYAFGLSLNWDST